MWTISSNKYNLLRFDKQSISSFFRRVTNFHRICHSNYRKILQDNSRERRIFRVMLQSSPRRPPPLRHPPSGPRSCAGFPHRDSRSPIFLMSEISICHESGLRNFSLIRPTISTPKFCAPCNLARIIFRRDTSDSSTKGRETFTGEIRELYIRESVIGRIKSI